MPTRGRRNPQYVREHKIKNTEEVGNNKELKEVQKK